MKVIFTLLFVILIQVTYAQKYQPLVEEGRYWIYDHYDLGPCFLKDVRAKEIRYFSGDTIINGYTFKKLVSSFVPLNIFPLEISTKVTLCLMREDTIERKVYMVNNNDFVFPCFDGQEVCIWDFGLSVGDTIRDCAYNILDPYDITGRNYSLLDSILYLKNQLGLESKHFYTIGVKPAQCNDPAPSVISYVEGFGTEDGPIIAFYGIILKNYCEGTMEQCNIISSTKDDFESSNFQPKIFPNPSWDRITIQTDYEVKNIEIINHTGQVVHTGETKDVDISILASGMYYVKVYSRENNLYMGKFI